MEQKDSAPQNAAGDQSQQLRVKTDDQTLKGFYSNVMQVAHTKDEFFLDFFIAAPPNAQLLSRIILSPAHAKKVLKVLTENMEKYESSFGYTEPSKHDTTIGYRAD